MTQQMATEIPDLVISRRLNATQKTVFEAWSDPEKMVQWFAPNERWRRSQIDCEGVPGGKHNIVMVHSDGDTAPILGKYVDFDPHNRLSFTWEENDASMGQLESLVTIDIVPSGDGCELTLTHTRMGTAERREAFKGGWTGCIEMLERWISGETDILK